jgi:signal transduction histidine kinase/FixJ family two-component response regulator
MCKTRSRFSEQIIDGLSLLLPIPWINVINTRIGHFLGLFVLTSLVVSSVLFLVYLQITAEGNLNANIGINDALAMALTNVFFILLIIFGVVAWMFSLARDSRNIAHQESEDQTKLLRTEIKAHQATDRALQKAKELAEAANLAKSRYLTGISHELRSPLNAIMGYAQLLEKDPTIPTHRRGALSTIRRSSEHLADLIEGLLDISRIEAGRLDLERSDVQLNELLDQLVSMFSMQAKNKNIRFQYIKHTHIPATVRTDQKRLRQVLINLLSNAVKYTQEGSIIFSVSYKNQVAEFKVIDTGVGINEHAIEKIFLPFERIRKPGQPHVTGTGLGLTITRLLVDIMGGNIQVKSQPDAGSEFSVALMLSSVVPLTKPIEDERFIIGYKGEPRNIFVVDDEPEHRALLNEILTPLNFNVVMAQDGIECLDMLKHCLFNPDIFLLDISMPGMSGWNLAQSIRKQFPDSAILMTSANAHVHPTSAKNPSNGLLVKPIRHPDLFKLLHSQAGIDWLYQCDDIIISDNQTKQIITTSTQTDCHESSGILNSHIKQEIIRLAQIGYVNAIREKLTVLQNQLNHIPDNQNQHKELQDLMELVDNFQFPQIIEKLKGSDQ